jgi:hypothetical protein
MECLALNYHKMKHVSSTIRDSGEIDTISNSGHHKVSYVLS